MSAARPRRIIIISGLSGSGKSVALTALEDMGFYCIDNLPLALLPEFATQLVQPSSKASLAAVSIDSRNLDLLPTKLSLDKNDHLLEEADLKNVGIEQQILFIECSMDTLIRRYSETRRKHPLTNRKVSLVAGIKQDIELLSPLRDRADKVIDTSKLTPHELREQIRIFASGKSSKDAGHGPQLMFESFGFKHGVPVDADFVFDVRCLPNPYWEESIRHLNGLDQPIIEFLQKEASVEKMVTDIGNFIENWLPQFSAENRSYLTVAVGCTGGRHRSVYTVEALRKRFSGSSDPVTGSKASVQLQHRDLIATD